MLEYLKGGAGGCGEITAVITDESLPFNTRLGAFAFSQDLLKVRRTDWDKREAILFLSAPPELSSTAIPDHYWLGWVEVQGGRIQKDSYSVRSGEYKNWLPAVDLGSIGEAQSIGAFSDRERQFLTGATPAEGRSIDTVSHKTANISYNRALGTGGDSSTITLSSLKNLISELEQELADGDGSDEYEQCVYEKYKWDREFQYFLYSKDENHRQSLTGHHLVSGLPAGTAFGRGRWEDPDPRRLVDIQVAPTTYESWLEGSDAGLFHLGNLPIIYNARPLPQVGYTYYYNERDFKYIPCDAYPEARRTWNLQTVEVSAPQGTLHESFFDLVDTGDGAVGAGNNNGVLKPDTFDTEGAANTTIERIEWASGSVRIELDPFTTLVGHRIDFIALDGTVSLRLDFDHASEIGEGTSRALSWNVCEQPWSEGDLLMLRIAAGVPDDGVQATNDVECPVSGNNRSSVPAAVLTANS